MKKLFAKLLGDETGTAMAEYALIATLVGGVGVVAFTALGQDLKPIWNAVKVALG